MAPQTMVVYRRSAIVVPAAVVVVAVAQDEGEGQYEAAAAAGQACADKGHSVHLLICQWQLIDAEMTLWDLV